MKRTLTLLAASAMLCWSSTDACTSLIVGKNASTDGSVLCTYSCDSFGTFHSLDYLAAGKHAKGEKRQIYDRDTHIYHGEIPEAETTYAVMGNINEWQVTIGETTFGGRKEMEDSTGIIDYGSLMALALQRAKTAREAIGVMTRLAETYGFCSPGESFTICDPNEAWIMEMMGTGAGSKGVVWVAMRIPDNAICAHANQSRITTFNQRDKENVLFSKNCISYARKQGWFSGKDADFSFRDAYAAPDFGGRRWCEARVWTFFRRFADGFDRYLPYVLGKEKNAESMPLWIVPNRKVSLADIVDCHHDHYEGTPLAMDNDLGQGIYESPYRPTPLTYEVDGKKYFNERPIATQQSSFVWIGQMRSWLPRQVGGILWFVNDDSNMAPFTPVYCCNTSVPRCYDTPGADAITFSQENAYWVCNWVANMVYPRYSELFPALKQRRDSLDNHYRTVQPDIERRAVELCKLDEATAVKYLTQYSNEKGEQMLQTWRDLATYLIVKYNDYGAIRTEENGRFKTNSSGFNPIIKRVGYPASTARRLVEENGDRFLVPEE